MSDQTRDVFVDGDIEVREGVDGTPTKIVGYAAVFNQETIINGPEFQWRERIAPNAFAGAISRDDVIAAVNHDHQKVLGRSRRGTLKLDTDAHGLRYEVALGRTTLAQDTAESVRRGDYAGSSFKFIPGDVRVAEKPSKANPLPLVIVESVKRLIDVGPVTFPAYQGASVSVRSAPDVVAECYATEAERLRLDTMAEMDQALADRRAWGR